MSSPRARLAERDFSVCVVTHDDAADLLECLDAIAALAVPPREVLIADCASRDKSVDVARSWRGSLAVRVLALGENRGFAGGMNAALAAASSPWVVSLNAEARPATDYVERLLDRAAASGAVRVGAVTGRLLRFAVPGEPDRLDACGMRLSLAWRHLDRGAGEPDRGQWGSPERVFGATGAATLYRRAALDDVALDGQIFDERYHSFREDAELSFRLRERGWEILYEPSARARHRRTNLPERRRAMPAEVNFHSLKNRYLLRLDHQGGANLVLTLVPTLARDLLALAYVIWREPGSRSAYAWLWQRRAALWAHRRALRERRTVAQGEVDRWFFEQGRPA